MTASIQKKEREMAQKARAQQKRLRKVERRQATAKGRPPFKRIRTISTREG